jgi:peptidoglycan hydrolase CwlO-like protein
LDKDIAATEQEKKTLQNQIRILRNRISQLDLQIRQSTIVIGDLGQQIQNTEQSIRETIAKIEENTQMLSAVLRVIYEEDQRSLIEILLSEGVSDFFENLVALEALGDKNKEVLEDIKDLKDYLESQKKILGGEKTELEGVVRGQTLQLQESQTARREQERLLGMTEAQYQDYIQQKEITEQRAAEIRARIFQLAGISEVEMPTFGEALEIAQWVEQQTGVRPALLLSIITQESALARNVGQCYLADLKSGTTYHITSNRQFPRGIHPRRDLPPFLQITKEVARDPLQTPLSCWIDVGRGPNYGWGGAMGPAQFIPSTWMSIRDNVSSITGNSAANPWSVRDSFLAAGLYLRNLGAASNELLAAGRYFGAPGLLSYDSTVVRRANCLQIFIDKGTISAECERLVFAPQ